MPRRLWSRPSRCLISQVGTTSSEPVSLDEIAAKREAFNPYVTAWSPLVRAAKFIARKNWIITGADDTQLRVFNYNTHEKVHSWDGHSDFIRCLAVHPTQPYVLSGSDDMTIRLWDWEKSWKCMQVSQDIFHGDVTRPSLGPLY